MRKKEIDLPTDEAERLAREAEHHADGPYAKFRTEAKRAYFRVIADGFRTGALQPVNPVWDPREHPGTPPPDWIEQHAARRRYARARLAELGLELPACVPCRGRYCDASVN